MVTFDTSGLDALAAALKDAIRDAPEKVHAAARVSAFNVKKDAQRRIGGLKHAPYYPAAITYDTRMLGSGPEAEIGPDKNRAQGALGNILEYGTSNNGPIPHLGPALTAEIPGFLNAIERIADGTL